MQFKTSSRLLGFLNRPHGPAIRLMAACAGWPAGLLLTRSATLAGHVFDVFRRDHFLIGCRKIVRYLRYAAPFTDIFNDPLFDIAIDTNAAERHALQRRLEAARRRLPEYEYYADLLFVQGAEIHQRLCTQQPVDDTIDTFYRLADKTLASAERITPTPKQMGSARPGNFYAEAAATALADMARQLPIADWPWFVISGTFLGLHRDCGFLPSEHDIDLGIHAEQIDVDAFIATLCAMPNIIIKKIDSDITINRDATGRRRLDQRKSLIKMVHRNGISIDFFIHRTYNGVCWHGSSIQSWWNTPFTLEQRTLAGTTVYAPSDADTYLTENYGDWRTPVTQFNSSTGTPNIEIDRNFRSLAFFIKRYGYFRQYVPEQAESLGRTLEKTGILDKSKQTPILCRII